MTLLSSHYNKIRNISNTRINIYHILYSMYFTFTRLGILDSEEGKAFHTYLVAQLHNHSKLFCTYNNNT